MSMITTRTSQPAVRFCLCATCSVVCLASVCAFATWSRPNHLLLTCSPLLTLRSIVVMRASSSPWSALPLGSPLYELLIAAGQGKACLWSQVHWGPLELVAEGAAMARASTVRQKAEASAVRTEDRPR